MKKKSIPITRFFPNIVTFFSLCVGLTSIKLSLAGKWEIAVVAILISAILDCIDGRLARILDSESSFGAELDSLADLISFGVAPAFLLYFWQLSNVKVLGWSLTMAFVLCIAIRLARFNSTIDQGDDSFKYFFIGIPAPISGILALLPVIMTFNECHYVNAFINNQYFIPVYITAIATLTVSRIPTFSAKHIKIPSWLDYIFTFLFAMIVILLLAKPWITIPLLACIYLLSMPFSIFMHSKIRYLQ